MRAFFGLQKMFPILMLSKTKSEMKDLTLNLVLILSFTSMGLKQNKGTFFTLYTECTIIGSLIPVLSQRSRATLLLPSFFFKLQCFCLCSLPVFQVTWSGQAQTVPHPPTEVLYCCWERLSMSMKSNVFTMQLNCCPRKTGVQVPG